MQLFQIFFQMIFLTSNLIFLVWRKYLLHFFARRIELVHKNIRTLNKFSSIFSSSLLSNIFAGFK